MSGTILEDPLVNWIADQDSNEGNTWSDGIDGVVESSLLGNVTGRSTVDPRLNQRVHEIQLTDPRGQGADLVNKPIHDLITKETSEISPELYMSASETASIMAYNNSMTAATPPTPARRSPRSAYPLTSTPVATAPKIRTRPSNHN